jgi:hypothetical protein
MLGKVWLIEELFHYKYPFIYPIFQQKTFKHELLVRVKSTNFSSVNIEKESFL